MQDILFGRKRTVFQRKQTVYGRAVGIFARAVLKPVENAEQRPHTLVEMRIEVAMENCVAYRPCQTSCAVEDIQGITFLGAYRN